jgi:hypothetical protein
LEIKKMLRPAGAMLVGLALLFGMLSLEAGAARPFSSNYTEALDRIIDFHSRFTSPASRAPEMGRPGFLSNPGDGKERILMNGSIETFKGLVAVNARKEREISFDGRLDPLYNPAKKINSMDIDVSRITVIAINTVKGGSAVATSDIVLSPVQYIDGSAGGEARVKLE